MKPEQINWITVTAFGEYPEKDTLLLLSTHNPGLYGDQTNRVVEGFYFPYGRDDKEEGSVFVDKSTGDTVIVYAWAYKPECMLNQNQPKEN